jgi:glycosyltransferase involved in cell wall biosynthesis
MKILIAHPGKQHSFKLASALKKQDLLFKYVTSVYYKENSKVSKIINCFLSKDNRERARKRNVKLLKDSDVHLICEFRGYLLLLLIRLFNTSYLTKKYNDYLRITFQKKLAKYIIINKVDLVVSYDTNSDLLFEILKEKAPNVRRVIDHAHAPRNFLHEAYKPYLNSSGKFIETLRHCGYILDKNYAHTFSKEISLADYHIVASQFSKKGLLFNGVKESAISVIPYGVSSETFKPENKSFEGVLKVLFVGEINQRKGISYLLEASKLLFAKGIEFNIVGRGVDGYEELYEPYNDCVNFHGHVSFTDLHSFFRESHVFVFPTLGEGYGLVLLEALSAGIPVITTANAGGPDFVRNGCNGFIIETGSVNAIVDKINELEIDRNMLREMSVNARESIADMTWDSYDENIVKAIKQINIL